MRLDLRRLGTLAVLITPLAAAPPQALAQAEAPPAAGEVANLVVCNSLDGTKQLREKADLLADHLRAGYAETHPAAVIMAGSMAELATALDSQLRTVEPIHQEFQAAWAEFDRRVRQSFLPRDPALGPVLPGFKSSAVQLESLLGCEPPADQSGMIPCTAIPIAHLLAVVGGQIDQYLSGKYSENLPEQVEAGAELNRAAKALHHVLHDLEVAIPGTRLLFEALDTSFESTMLTDENDIEDLEAKALLAAVGEAVRGLDGRVASCHEAAESHEGH
jgi:hypothetical protein